MAAFLSADDRSGESHYHQKHQNTGYKKTKWKGRRKTTIFRVGIFFLAYIFIFMGISYFSKSDTGRTTYTALKDTSRRVKRSLGFESFSGKNDRVGEFFLLERHSAPNASDDQ
jgi:hypothetical protein